MLNKKFIYFYDFFFSYQMNVLDENARHSALILCTLLLSAANQHVLIYFLNVSDVIVIYVFIVFRFKYE